MLSTKRLTPILVVVVFLLACLFFLNTSSTFPSSSKPQTVPAADPAVGTPEKADSQTPGQSVVPEQAPDAPTAPAAASSAAPVPASPAPTSAKPGVAISYDKTTPPTVGCEDIVHDLQERLLAEYQKILKGVRYANIWGYLETENKGDAAIWAAQQILLNAMGITSMEACRFLDRDCDVEKFTAALERHKPHSAIIMAGGGNFNDFYWEDQPSRMKMIQHFTDYPIRAFPQSIHMTHDDRVKATKEAFNKHDNLQLAARDQPSYDWLVKSFGKDAKVATPNKIKHHLLPDIAFMFGSRPDFRTETKKLYDVLILARDDWEVAEGDSKAIPMGTGELDLGGSVGKVTYHKVDWKVTPTPGINAGEVTDFDGTKYTTAERENGVNQRAWAKAIQGFRMLGSADLVITDRLHGHIMSTIIGTPHVLMDSKLKKNLNFHDTWTKDCGCTRVADNIEEAKNFARMFFEEKRKHDELEKAKGA